MEVEYCDIVYDSQSYEMTISLNLDSTDVHKNSLENIVKRIGVFERRFLPNFPLWVSYGGKHERVPDERRYKYEFDIFRGNVKRPKVLNVCDLNISTDLKGVFGTTIDAVFKYYARSIEDAKDFVKMTELFSRYCFGSRLEDNKEYVDKLNSVWHEVVYKVGDEEKRIKELIDDLVYENSLPSDVKAILESIKIINQ